MRDGQSVGLIGIGLMGEAFARRLIDAGFTVLGFDLEADKRARLIEVGGAAAESVGEVARHCAPILLAVFNTDQVEDVVENGIIPALDDASGKILLCTSTCDPDRIAALASRVVARGVRFLETPVSGAS